MIKKDEFETLINNIKAKLDDTTNAMASEEILATLSAYNSAYDDYEKIVNENTKLKAEKEELLKVNGKLYQKIGFDKDEDKSTKVADNKDNDEDKISINDIIDEKGELI